MMLAHELKVVRYFYMNMDTYKNYVCSIQNIEIKNLNTFLI